MKRLAYLGPPGTFSEQAALRWDGAAELVPLPTFAAVAAAVESGDADEGIVAIENSLQGSVTDTVDILIHETLLQIAGEVVVPIEQFLLARPGVKIEQVRVLFAHPQSHGQSRKFVERHLPSVQVEAALSNSSAVEEAMTTEDAAAIGTRRASEIYGAAILAEGIQDSAGNLTRFVVLAAHDAEPTGLDRTSLAFEPDNLPGSLVRVLLEFSNRDINLSKIESRPSKELLGEYIILIDLEGHRSEPAVAEALEGVRAQTRWMKVFGSYPRARESATPA